MWAKYYERCIRCGTVDIRHLARGLCSRCYYKTTDERNKGRRNKGEIVSKLLTKQFLEEEYLNKKRSTCEIARAVGCTRQYVSHLLSEYGIPRRSLTSARAIALGRGKIALVRTNKLGKDERIVLQKREVNEDFFSSWSKEMAWVLGIIYTDGYIDPGKQENKLRKTSNTTAFMSIGQKEPELLLKVTSLMDSNALLIKHPGEVLTFTINNNRIYNDLVKIGLRPHKSLDVTFPEVPKEYLSHFIRGCWDGDGSIGFYDGQYLARFFSGSLVFIERLVKHLIESGLPQRKIYVKYTKRNKPYYSINYKGENTARVYEYLYRDANPSCYLERKYELFKSAYQKYRIKGL